MTTTHIPEWTFGERLEKARKDAGLKQEDMAAILEVSPATISNWETQARKPQAGQLEIAKRWAEETDVDEVWLLLGVTTSPFPAEAFATQRAIDALPPFRVLGRAA